MLKQAFLWELKLDLESQAYYVVKQGTLKKLHHADLLWELALIPWWLWHEQVLILEMESQASQNVYNFFAAKIVLFRDVSCDATQIYVLWELAFLVAQPDDLCIDIWVFVMIICLSTQITERQGTAMY